MDAFHIDTIQVDREIPDNEVIIIAAYFYDVGLYSQAMDLSASEQHDVKTTFLQHDAYSAMMKCLRLWKSHHGFKATYRALLELLLRLNKIAVAAEVGRYLSQNVSIRFHSLCQ